MLSSRQTKKEKKQKQLKKIKNNEQKVALAIPIIMKPIEAERKKAISKKIIRKNKRRRKIKNFQIFIKLVIFLEYKSTF